MPRTFAIGDIHGESTLLADLLRQLHAEARAGDKLVFLGDYINRGPDTRGVIDLVLAQREQWPGPVITLMGNHEQMLRHNLLCPSPGTWMRYRQAMSGEPTCRSYGAEDLSLVRFVAHLPPGHRRFILEELLLWHEDEHAVYVHAGIPPSRHPRDCVPEQLLWNTVPEYTWEKPVIFGHEVQPGGAPLDAPDRIGLDTGAGFGGPLTAVMLPDRTYSQAPAG